LTRPRAPRRDVGGGYARVVATTADWSARLRSLAPAAWPAAVEADSGLPGPRANLALVEACARSADAAAIAALLESGGEFATMCAAAAIARHAGDPAQAERARTLAADDRWRVREGVVIGLQYWGDAAPAEFRELATQWVASPDPLVQRAAVAAVCEPRLLREREAASAALAVCAAATASLAELPAARRRDSDVRTLRQALGYGWSVAIAADPGDGLPLFDALDVTDPDIAWIVRENLRKKRLQAVRATPAP